MIKERYSIGDVVEVKPFVPIFSKFNDPSSLFSIVETTQGIFFVKKYYQSQIGRAKNDVEKSTQYLANTTIQIPQLIRNKDNEYLTEFQGSIFTVSRYIDGVDLRTEAEVQMRDNNPEFFPLYSQTNTELKKISKERTVSFEDRYWLFMRNVNQLETAIKSSQFPSAPRDLEYLEFLKTEVENNRSEILNFQTKGQILHGDFLKQNIIRDKNNNFWIVDWEKSDYGFVEVDLMKTITFTLFKPDPERVNLEVSEIANILTSIQPYLKSSFKDNSASKIFRAYYYFLITNIHSLIRLYVNKVDVKEQMIREDFNIVRWYKNNLTKLEEEVKKLR
ncbi:MAG TPA: phosphotransferase [Patescibacteria group bacterium]